jgi:hypothetical protein
MGLNEKLETQNLGEEDFFLKKRLGFLQLGLIISPFIEANRFILSGHSKEEAFSSISASFCGLLGFGMMDFIKAYVRGAREILESTENLMQLKLRDSSFAKLVGRDYEKEVLRNLMELEEIHRIPCYNVVSMEEISNEEGIGPYRGGYTLLVTAKPDILDRAFGKLSRTPRKELKFVHKYSKKHKGKNLEREGLLTTLFQELGIDVAPKVLSTQRRHQHDKHLEGRLNVGVSYEYFDGKSLDSLTYPRGERKGYVAKGKDSNHLKPEFTKDVEDSFDLMFQVYSHPQLRGAVLSRTLLTNSIGRLCKNGRVRLELEADDFWDPATIQEKARQAAVELTGFEPEPPKFEFNEKLVERFAKCDETFARVLNEEFERNFGDANSVLIHGDFHPGNILRSKDERKVIDWDNARIGIPYEDFFYFSATSGFEHNPDYERVRNAFLERQEKVIGKVEEEALELIEFETYINLADKFNECLEKGEIIEDCHKPVSNSCRYLLEKARDSLRKYSIRTDNPFLEELFQRLFEKKYGQIVSLENRDPRLEYNEGPFGCAAYNRFRGTGEESKITLERDNLTSHQNLLNEITWYNKRIGEMKWITPISFALSLGLAAGSVLSEDIGSYLNLQEDPLVLESMLRGFTTPLMAGGIFGLASIYGMKKKVNQLAKGS